MEFSIHLMIHISFSKQMKIYFCVYLFVNVNKYSTNEISNTTAHSDFVKCSYFLVIEILKKTQSHHICNIPVDYLDLGDIWV